MPRHRYDEDKQAQKKPKTPKQKVAKKPATRTLPRRRYDED